ncbi:MAG: phytanoyl-CoA dioxygenase family protein [Actinomycetota bacterium]
MAAIIPTCAPSTDPEEMYALLGDAGALVVHDMFDPGQRSAVRSELAEHLEAAHVGGDQPEDFYPGNTRRIVAIPHRSPTMRDLVMHDVVTELGDRHLGPNSTKWQLNVSAALEVGPGARDQVLHREEDLYPYFEVPRPNLILASMWAVTDFTADNGGTQIVPGSHRWVADRTAAPEEIVRAEMPAGSVLFWLGGTLHGAGANVTEDDWRYGVIYTFNLGWLRTEEAQHLSMPLSDALALDDELCSRLGFAMDYGDGALGFYDPSVLLSGPAPTFEY